MRYSDTIIEFSDKKTNISWSCVEHFNNVDTALIRGTIVTMRIARLIVLSCVALNINTAKTIQTMKFRQFLASCVSYFSIYISLRIWKRNKVLEYKRFFRKFSFNLICKDMFASFSTWTPSTLICSGVCLLKVYIKDFQLQSILEVLG